MSDLDLAIAPARAKKAKRGARAAETGFVEQTMSGFNEGLAGALGFPVDTVNSLFQRPVIESSMDFDEAGIPRPSVQSVNMETFIEKPFGGSQTFLDLMDPVISDAPPQTTAQRYGRRVGQEAGSMAIPGGVAMRGAKAPLALSGTETASAIGSGVAGQTAQEIAPDNAAADAIASFLGGVSPVVAARALRPGPSIPSVDDLRSQQAAAYDAVDQSRARLSPEGRQGVIDALSGTAERMDMDEFLHPRANRTLSRMESLEASPRIADVEQKRRLIGRDVAGSLDPSESAIGVEMKNEIDRYLSNVAREGNLGVDAEETLSQLARGRELTQQIKRHETIAELLAKAERRAATSGTGGNEVNAIRQNLRTILDNPKKRRQFNKEQLRQIERIVEGTPGINAARLVGRLSPTSGALPLMAGIAGTAAGTSVGGPAGTAIGMGSMLAGSASKGIAEAMTKNQVDRLLEEIRYGGEIPKKGISGDDLRGLIAALLSQSAGAPESTR